MEITRLELVTPCLQGRCSPNWAIPPGMYLNEIIHHLIINIYSILMFINLFTGLLVHLELCNDNHNIFWFVVIRLGLNGLEPSTSRLSGVRSNQLSYKPVLFNLPSRFKTYCICSLSKNYLYFLTYKVIFIIRQPPALPYRLQYSTIGRLRLNHRVRDGNGCVP